MLPGMRMQHNLGHMQSSITFEVDFFPYVIPRHLIRLYIISVNVGLLLGTSLEGLPKQSLITGSVV